jgi:hypothetical protein
MSAAKRINGAANAKTGFASVTLEDVGGASRKTQPEWSGNAI